MVLKSKIESRSFSIIQRTSLAILACIGLGVASYLAWHGFAASKVVGCAGNQIFDCEHVLNSRWSKILGMPVSVLAIGAYGTILTSLVVLAGTTRRRLRNAADNTIVIGSVTAGIAAIWFISLQAFVLGHFCLYCLAAHGCSIGLAVIAILQIRKLNKFASQSGESTRTHLISGRLVAGMGVAGVLVVAMLQVSSQPEPTYTIEAYVVEESTSNETEEFDPMSDGEVFDPFDVGDDEVEIEEEQVARDDLDLKENAEDRPSNTSVGWHQEKGPRESGRVPLSTFAAILFRPSILLGGWVQAGDTGESDEAVGEKLEVEQKVSRKVAILGRSVTLNSAQWPVVGKSDAKYMVVEMFDYTCPHCRKTHAALAEASKEFGEDLALLMIPVPMHSGCNDTVTVDHEKHRQACKFAKLAIGVWLTSPGEFSEFHKWLMEAPEVPTTKEALRKAAELVDAEELKTTLESKVPGRYLKNTVRLYKKSGKGAIPKLLFPTTALVGKTESASVIRQMVEQHLQ